MINDSTVAVSHVSGCHQIHRVVHDVIIFTVNDQRLLESSAVCCDSEASVKNRASSFSNPLVLPTVVLQ